MLEEFKTKKNKEVVEVILKKILQLIEKIKEILNVREDFENTFEKDIEKIIELSKNTTRDKNSILYSIIKYVFDKKSELYYSYGTDGYINMTEMYYITYIFYNKCNKVAKINADFKKEFDKIIVEESKYIKYVFKDVDKRLENKEVKFKKRGSTELEERYLLRARVDTFEKSKRILDYKSIILKFIKSEKFNYQELFSERLLAYFTEEEVEFLDSEKRVDKKVKGESYNDDKSKVVEFEDDNTLLYHYNKLQVLFSFENKFANINEINKKDINKVIEFFVEILFYYKTKLMYNLLTKYNIYNYRKVNKEAEKIDKIKTKTVERFNLSLKLTEEELENTFILDDSVSYEVKRNDEKAKENFINLLLSNQYEKFCEKLIERLRKKESIIVESCYCIKHDKDYHINNVKKDEHLHILIELDTRVKLKYLSKCLLLADNSIEITKKQDAMLAYLCHVKESYLECKYLYSKDEVITVVGTDYNEIYEKNIERWETEAIKKGRNMKYLKERVNNLIHDAEFKKVPLKKIKGYDVLFQNKTIKQEIDAYINHKLKKRTEEFQEKFNKGEIQRLNVYIVGDSGTGKSRLAKTILSSEMERKFGYNMYDASTKDSLGKYEGEEIVVHDDLRTDKIEFQQLLKIFDVNAASQVDARFHNKYQVSLCQFVTITKNLKEFFRYAQGVSKKSGDFENLDQGFRRFELIIKVINEDNYILYKQCYSDENIFEAELDYNTKRGENVIVKDIKVKCRYCHLNYFYCSDESVFDGLLYDEESKKLYLEEEKEGNKLTKKQIEDITKINYIERKTCDYELSMLREEFEISLSKKALVSIFLKHSEEFLYFKNKPLKVDRTNFYKDRDEFFRDLGIKKDEYYSTLDKEMDALRVMS